MSLRIANIRERAVHREIKPQVVIRALRWAAVLQKNCSKGLKRRDSFGSHFTQCGVKSNNVHDDGPLTGPPGSFVPVLRRQK